MTCRPQSYAYLSESGTAAVTFVKVQSREMWCVRMRCRSALGVVVAVALVTPIAASAAYASDTVEVSEAIEAIEAIEATVLSSLVPQDPDNVGTAVDWVGEGVSIEVPQVASEGISLTTAEGTVGIGLPTASSAEDAAYDPSGAVAYDNSNATTTVATVRKAGSVQITTVIEDASAPTEYAYPMDLPAAAQLSMHEDGSVSVLSADGDLVAIVDVPWAKDASGASVPTFYRITGSTLTQVVQHQGAAYPVVADPWWIPVLGVMARISAHAAQQIAARNISQNLIRIALQEGKRTKGNEKGTSVFSANGIRVVVNDKTGNIITVIRAGGGGSSGGR